MNLFFETKSFYIDDECPMPSKNYYLVGKSIHALNADQIRSLAVDFDREFLDHGNDDYEEMFVAWYLTDSNIPEAQDITECFEPAIVSVTKNALPF